ncbi:MAG: lasso peptide biosynthesis PqqD family chaperone [Deltaproteobacteria bacterium]|nr:lasso peptide biosynthesis PqqD family chaperone [Deltaproteobacteria bacterium]
MTQNVDIGPDTVIARSDDIVAADMDGEVVMMNIDTGKYYALDPIAGDIWSLTAEPISVAALCQLLMERYEVTQDVCRHDVTNFLRDINDDGIIKIVAAAGA